MQYEGLKFDKKDGIGILTLNRPQKFNAITVLTLYRELPNILREIQEDDEVRVLIITGSGKAFCAGAELSQNWEDLPSFGLGRNERLQPLGAFAVSLYNLEKPVIAAINGAAVGAGVSFALLSDIRIASEAAKFSFAFVKRGVVPDCGISFLTPRLIGMAKAFELMYSGDFIDAKEAERIGLVNKVVPHENLMPEAVELANRLVNEPPLTLAQIKRALHNGMINTLEQQLYFEAYAQKFCWGTRDFKESITAFFEKRAPLFTGE